MKRPAVFLDRDGTINEQVGYLNHKSRFRLLDGVPEAVRMLNREGYRVVVVSNQSGVARGYFPLSLVHEVNDYMKALLEAQGAFLDDILFCPHHPEGSVPAYAVSCKCRKPGTGLIEKALGRFEIDLARSYVIGDQCTDVEMARRAACRGIMVQTGYGMGESKYLLPNAPSKPVYIASDLLQAVRWIFGSG